MKRIILLLFILVLPVTLLAQVCPPEGSGGDKTLNRLKNRAQAPSSYKEMTVEQYLKDFTPNLNTPKHRDKFTSNQNSYIQPREKEGIALVGYILGAKQSGPESCNCNDQTRRDFHVWIGAKKPASTVEANAMRDASVVVEPTPSGQEAHTSWRLHNLQKLAQQGAKVRISGWAMYDPEHPNEIGKTRGTVWEVHPVFKIEVFNKGQWQEL
jgi:hypothetical protein